MPSRDRDRAAPARPAGYGRPSRNDVCRTSITGSTPVAASRFSRHGGVTEYWSRCVTRVVRLTPPCDGQHGLDDHRVPDKPNGSHPGARTWVTSVSGWAGRDSRLGRITCGVLARDPLGREVRRRDLKGARLRGSAGRNSARRGAGQRRPGRELRTTLRYADAIVQRAEVRRVVGRENGVAAPDLADAPAPVGRDSVAASAGTREDERARDARLHERDGAGQR